MKKVIYTISITVITASVIFYFNIAGGKDDRMPVTKSGENIQASGLQPEENNINSHSSSQYSPRSGGWQLQVMPNMGSRLVRDLYFTDSLTGYAVASPDSYTDSAHILKTTNGGNNWSIKYTAPGRLLGIKFLNNNIGFAGGNKFLKTTNAGENWVVWNWGILRIAECMSVFSEDTIWYGWTDPTSGGVFRTTNGGINWEKRDSGIPANSYPFYIYFYNSRIGFATGGTSVYKTTDAGLSWSLAFTGGAQKLYFRDSLNGYRTSQGFFRTTNGGLNWSKDSLPSVMGNVYTRKWITDFCRVNNNTIYAIGASIQFLSNFIYKGIVYKTTNNGVNWGYQIPDTSFGCAWFDRSYAINNNIWAYTTNNNKGIYSSTGGDSTIYLGVRPISSVIPASIYILQNYPNPFNPLTKIRFGLSKSGNISLRIFDINGKIVKEIINNISYHAGEYEYTLDGSNLSSGVYFYSLTVNDGIIQTRKMVLLK